MAFEIIGEFVVKGTKKAEQQFKGVTSSVGRLNTELKDNRDATSLLNDATGGYSSTVLDFKDKIVGGFTAIKNLTKGMKLLKVAMISSGIGALVVLLAGIAANWETITAYMSGASLESQALVASTAEIAEAEQKKLDLLNGQDNILRMQGKSEKEILQLKAEQTKETINALEASILAQEEVKKQQVATAKRNQDILSGILKFVALPLTAILSAYDYITGSNTSKIFDDAASLMFDPEGIAEEADKTIEETKKNLNRLKNTYAGYQLSINKIDKDASDKKKASRDEKKANDDAEAQKALDKRIADEAAALSAIEKLEDEHYLRLKSQRDQEVQGVTDKYFNLIAQAEKFGLDKSVIEEAQREELRRVNDKYDKIADKADKESLARKKIIEKQKVASVANSFGQLAGILGKNSAAGKSAAIAQATINTYQGVTEVWSTKSVLPEPFATIQKIVSTATVLASGLQTVQKIKSVPKPQGVKGGGSSGGGSGGGGMAPPSFNIVGGSDTNQLADTIAESTNKPSRSYVVSSDVTTAQELERKTVADASI